MSYSPRTLTMNKTVTQQHEPVFKFKYSGYLQNYF